MRGDDRQQAKMFSYISPEERVPLDHPLRVIREMVDRTYSPSRSPYGANDEGSRRVSKNVKTGNIHGLIGHIMDTCKRKGLRVSPQPLEIFGGAVGDRTPDLMTASPSPLFGEFASQGWISLYSCRLAKNVHRSRRVSQG